MLFDVSVENLVKKTGNAYVLANLLGKRAKQIAQNPPQEVIDEKKIPLEVACEEIERGDIVAQFPSE